MIDDDHIYLSLGKRQIYTKINLCFNDLYIRAIAANKGQAHLKSRSYHSVRPTVRN